MLLNDKYEQVYSSSVARDCLVEQDLRQNSELAYLFTFRDTYSGRTDLARRQSTQADWRPCPT